MVHLDEVSGTVVGVRSPAFYHGRCLRGPGAEVPLLSLFAGCLLHSAVLISLSVIQWQLLWSHALIDRMHNKEPGARGISTAKSA